MNPFLVKYVYYQFQTRFSALDLLYYISKIKSNVPLCVR